MKPPPPTFKARTRSLPMPQADITPTILLDILIGYLTKLWRRLSPPAIAVAVPSQRELEKR